jgi:ABC-type multidrug transport system fused ATPase/permease subunit
MFKMIKKLPPLGVFAAIIFLLVQVASMLYLPYVTADIVNKGLMMGDIAHIWSQGLLMIVVSFGGLLGALLNTLIFSKISYTLGGELRNDIYRKAMSTRQANEQRTSSTINIWAQRGLVHGDCGRHQPAGYRRLGFQPADSRLARPRIHPHGSQYGVDISWVVWRLAHLPRKYWQTRGK